MCVNTHTCVNTHSLYYIVLITVAVQLVLSLVRPTSLNSYSKLFQLFYFFCLPSYIHLGISLFVSRGESYQESYYICLWIWERQLQCAELSRPQTQHVSLSTHSSSVQHSLHSHVLSGSSLFHFPLPLTSLHAIGFLILLSPSSLLTYRNTDNFVYSSFILSLG